MNREKVEKVVKRMKMANSELKRIIDMIPTNIGTNNNKIYLLNNLYLDLADIRDSIKDMINGDELVSNVEVITELPLITLRNSNYNEASSVDLYAIDLIKAKIGDKFYAVNTANCARDCFEETLTVLYKDDEGVFCRLNTYTTTDSPNPVEESHITCLYFNIRRDITDVSEVNNNARKI